MTKYSLQNKKVLVTSAIALVCLLVFSVFVYIPARKQAFLFRKEIRAIDEQIKSVHERVGSMKEMGKVLARMQKELVSFEKRIPTKDELSAVATEISDLAKTYSVEVVSIKSKGTEALLDEDGKPVIFGGKELRRTQANLHLQGTYRAIAEYINNMQKSLNILATIDEIKILKDEDISPRLDVTLVLTSFLVEEKGGV